MNCDHRMEPIPLARWRILPLGFVPPSFDLTFLAFNLLLEVCVLQLEVSDGWPSIVISRIPRVHGSQPELKEPKRLGAQREYPLARLDELDKQNPREFKLILKFGQVPA